MAMQSTLSGCHSGRMSYMLPCPTARRPAPFLSRTSRLQVYAKKGKGAFRRRNIEPQQYRQMLKEYSSTSTVAPPAVDAENEEFVIFIRDGSNSKNAWIPMTLVKGGTPANVLVRVAQTEWGKKLFQKTLIRNIAQAVYKGKDDIIKNIRKAQPTYVNTPSSAFQFAMKVRDKRDASSWSKAVDLTELPPEEEVAGTPIDNVKKFFVKEGLISS